MNRGRVTARRFAPPLAIAAVLLSAATALAAPGDIQRITLDTGGGDPDSGGAEPSISATGSFVAFQSDATDLVSGDAPGSLDVFGRIRSPFGAMERLSLTDADVPSANGSAINSQPAVSGAGEFIVFTSNAADLVAGDANGEPDIFVRGRTGATTTRVSVDGVGGDPNNDSRNPSIDTSGAVVAFTSEADDLGPADPNGGVPDIYARESGTNELISIASGVGGADLPSQFPAVSGDGDHVAFESTARNLLPVAEVDGDSDIFVRDRDAGTTVRASSSTTGGEGNGESTFPSISSDGRYVAFMSTASNLTADGAQGLRGIYVRDTVTASTERIDRAFDGSPASGSTLSPSISDDGRYVAFASTGDRIVPGDTNGLRDVFVRDRALGRTIRVNVSATGAQGDNFSGGTPPDFLRGVQISGGGNVVAFESEANNLVPGDTTPNLSPFGEIFTAEVDFSEPQTSIGTAPGNLTAPGRVAVGFGSNKSPTTFECRLDLGGSAPCSSPWLAPEAGFGAHTVSVRARDRLGNLESTPAAATFNVQQPDQPPPPPVFRRSFNLEPVSGTVFVTVPGGRRVRLEDVIQIPSGSLVDTRRGRVRLFAASTRRGSKIVSSEFYEGLFRVVQLRDGIIELRLAGGSFKGCAAKRSIASTSARKRKRIRRLWGKGKGRFRTRGKYGAAAIRGTTWLVEDRCDGTLVFVRVGTVTASDFAKRKRVIVRRGKRYLARPRARR